MANLSAAGQRQRMIVAAVMVVVAMAGLFLLLDQPRAWRLVLFVPLWIGALGAQQARAKT